MPYWTGGSSTFSGRMLAPSFTCIQCTTTLQNQGHVYRRYDFTCRRTIDTVHVGEAVVLFGIDREVGTPNPNPRSHTFFPLFELPFGSIHRIKARALPMWKKEPSDY